MSFLNRQPRTRQAGFSIVELMIAITISLVLLNGVIQMFLSTKQSYRIADGLGRMQENARYALDVLAEDIRMAGFLPCRKTNKIANVLNNNTGEYDFFGAPLIGFEGNASVFPAEFPVEGTTSVNRLVGSDGIRILRGDDKVYSVNVHNVNAANFKLNAANHDFNPGDIVLVCDAENATILQITNANQSNATIVHNTGTGSPGNCTKFLGFPGCPGGTPKVYDEGSQIVRFSSVIYYIGPSLATDPLNLKSNSLYRRELTNTGGATQFGNAQELVQGVETMQIVYGVALDPYSTAVRYVAANDVQPAEWGNVVSVRVGLLLHTPEEISPVVDDTTYNVVGTVMTTTSPVPYPADRRQRYVFSETIKVRNRGADVSP